jgi:hypothetical protein
MAVTKAWKYGDNAQAFTATLKAGGNAVDLNGATVTLRLVPNQGDPVTVTMTVDDAEAGEVSYQPTGTEHEPSAGRAEIKVTFSNEKTKRFPTRGFINYEIQPNLG